MTESAPAFHRVLLKLSGEALMGERSYGLDPERIAALSGEIVEVHEEGPDALAGLEERRLELIAKIGENVELVGGTRMEAGEGELLAEYVHPPANKIGVLVRVKGSDGTAARRLAMHISFAAPRYRSVDEVPAEELANERSIYENQADVQSKPEEVRTKIVEGRLRKEFLSAIALSEQSWIHDPSLTAGKALEEAGLEVVEFVRYALAE